MKLNVKYEDEHLLIAVKPGGVPAQGDKTNTPDMVSLVKDYLYEKNPSGGEPYTAVINRLDRPVGGLMLFAKTPEAAAKLSDLLQDGGIEKYYQAVITGEIPDEAGELTDYLVRDPKTNMSKVVDKNAKGAKKAVLTYELIDELETDEGILGLLLIRLITGRHHQIRCQLASRGCGIYGDVKYNPRFKGRKGAKTIGLYSTRIEFDHPITGEHVRVKQEPEGDAFKVIDLEPDY